MFEEIQFKPFWEDLQASVQRHRVLHLLHYTRTGNLGGILQAGGLLSRRRQAERGIHAAEVHGWGNKGLDLDDYICLSLDPPKGFLKRGGEWMALLVSTEVLGFEGSCYVPSNTARESVPMDEILSRGDLLSFEDLFRSPHGPRSRSIESEILVPSAIPLRYIRTILLPDRSAWWRALPVLWKHRFRNPVNRGETPRCRVVSDDRIFFANLPS
jgi:hypothetical protein